MQKISKISSLFFGILLSIIIINCSLFANNIDTADNSENIFFANNLIPTYNFSIFMKLPENIKFQSDNFYSSPNSLLFLMIRNLSRNNTKDLLAYKNQDIEIKIYSLIDRLQSEIFPYSEKLDTKGIAVLHNDKLIGIFCINKNTISSVNGRNFIPLDISEESLERFFKKYKKTIVLTKRDVDLKNLAANPEDILQAMVNDFNSKQFDNFYSYFSLKYKLYLLLDNFAKTNSFKYDPNQTFLGNTKDIKNIKISSIKNTLSTPQMSSILVYEITFIVTNNDNSQTEKKCFVFLNYSQTFGYRIYEIKQESKRPEQDIKQPAISVNETQDKDKNNEIAKTSEIPGTSKPPENTEANTFQ